LDYPGVGPEHSYLKDSGRAEYYNVTDEEALEGTASTLHFLLFCSFSWWGGKKFSFELFIDNMFLYMTFYIGVGMCHVFSCHYYHLKALSYTVIEVESTNTPSCMSFDHQFLVSLCNSFALQSLLFFLQKKVL